MVHLRLVVTPGRVDDVLDLLEQCSSVIDVVHLPGAVRKPSGDVVLCDVAREDASVVLSDLKHLGVHEDGSIAVEDVDSIISRAADAAERSAAGAPADAVIWEDVSARTSEESALSGAYLVFIVLATLIASVGIFLDSPILVVGAMVVGPEFGPLAGFCVALVERRRELALRSGLALVVGFPLAIGITYLAVLAFKATGVTPESFGASDHSLAATIANPDFFAFFVAFCAGVAGMLSLTTAKSGALIGVLISVTTIPAAANIAVAAGYGDTDSLSGSLQQLGINLVSLLAAGTLTVLVQRALYRRRRDAHRRRLRLGHSSVARRRAADDELSSRC